MGMASIPIWMEGALNRKYPEWKNVKRFEDGSAKASSARRSMLPDVKATLDLMYEMEHSQTVRVLGAVVVFTPPGSCRTRHGAATAA